MFDEVDEGDFKQVTSLLVAHGVEPVEAQRYVCSAVKGKSTSRPPTGFVELCGQGGLANRPTLPWPQRAGVGGARPPHVQARWRMLGLDPQGGQAVGPSPSPRAATHVGNCCTAMYGVLTLEPQPYLPEDA